MTSPPGRVLNRFPPGHVPAPDGGAAGYASSDSMAGNAPPETPPPSRAGGGLAWPCQIDRQRGQQGGVGFRLCSSTRIYTGAVGRPAGGTPRRLDPAAKRGQRGGRQAAVIHGRSRWITGKGASGTERWQSIRRGFSPGGGPPLRKQSAVGYTSLFEVSHRR